MSETRLVKGGFTINYWTHLYICIAQDALIDYKTLDLSLHAAR